MRSITPLTALPMFLDILVKPLADLPASQPINPKHHSSLPEQQDPLPHDFKPVVQIIQNIAQSIHEAKEVKEQVPDKPIESQSKDSDTKILNNTPEQISNTSRQTDSFEQPIKTLTHTLVSQGHLEQQILTAPPSAMLQASLGKLGELVKKEKKKEKLTKKKTKDEETSDPLTTLIKGLFVD